MATDTFEIGLVGAGAISAGAYTGGVMDFLVDALDCWEAARDADEAVPRHRVKLSVFAGASAGSICAALGTGYLASDQPPVRSEADAQAHPGRNKMFDSWVERIDIRHLLGNEDLRGEQQPVVSLLDSTVLQSIAQDGLDIRLRAQRRPFVAEEFDLLMTVTNLRGVPYAFSVNSYQSTSYDMSLHGDYVHVRLNGGGTGGPASRYEMKWSDLQGDSGAGKTLIRNAALASSAFPIGLAPRLLEHHIPGNGQPDYYSARLWSLPTPDSDPHRCFTLGTREPQWKDCPPAYDYRFQCVDGGVIDNEPLELARRLLAGDRGHNERRGDRASKALILIDPFPSKNTFDLAYQPARDLLGAGLRLFEALKNQARFKPDELKLASDASVFSRFMIAPSRGDSQYPIACGSLGGFGGFLKRSFRAHDYFLGRRNAQKFLRDHFWLPESNAIVQSWPEDVKREFCLKYANGAPMFDEQGQRKLPLVPLVGAARLPCKAQPWPEYTHDDLERLREQLAGRVDAVGDRLIDQYLSKNFFLRLGARLALWRKKEDVVDRVCAPLQKELRAMGLMREAA